MQAGGDWTRPPSTSSPFCPCRSEHCIWSRHRRFFSLCRSNLGWHRGSHKAAVFASSRPRVRGLPGDSSSAVAPLPRGISASSVSTFARERMVAHRGSRSRSVCEVEKASRPSEAETFHDDQEAQPSNDKVLKILAMGQRGSSGWDARMRDERRTGAGAEE